METRPLGKSGIRISAVGLGCWQFSKANGLAGSYWPAIDDEETRRIVSTSLAGGINWFDTAEAYGNGASERSLSHSLTSLGVTPGSVVVATKWMPVARTASSIGKTIDRRIDSLAPFGIDLYQIHNPWGFSSIAAEVKELAELVARGLVRSVGVSNFSAKQMREAHRLLAVYDIPLVSNQVRYSLIDRKIETNGVLDAAKELGITIIAYSPLSQGLLTGKFHDHPELVRSKGGVRRLLPRFRRLDRTLPLIDRLKAIGTKYGATAAQVSLNWVINGHGDTIVAIPGASSVSQAEGNAGALSFTLEPDDVFELSGVADSLRR
jgi:aryl-alcohol dehydrogenase-like predicted oxidoreductase